MTPSEFMAAAERYRLMPHVDRWVVQTALAALGNGAVRLAPGAACASTCRARRSVTAPSSSSSSTAWTAPASRRPHLLRGHRECGDHQHRARAALHRRAARHGLQSSRWTISAQPQLVFEPEEPAARLPEDRRLLHPQPRLRRREPGDGHRDDQAGALAEVRGDRRARRGHGFARLGAPDGRRLRAGLPGRPSRRRSLAPVA